MPAIKRFLTDSLATLEAKKGTALGGEGVGRLRQETQRPSTGWRAALG